MKNANYFVRSRATGLLLTGLVLLCGCSLLTPSNQPPVRVYSFDRVASEVNVKSDLSPASKLINTANATKTANKAKETHPVHLQTPTLVVSQPHAIAGFDSQRIAYIRQPYQLEYFRQSEWIAPPATMLLPVMVAALEQSGQFAAVLHAPSSIPAQLRLDVEIVRLQHEFYTLPSRVHLSIRAHLIDTGMRQVIAWHEFDAFATAETDDAYGGVLASNAVIQNVVRELTEFCVQAVNKQKPSSP